jgi:TP901 family phage tail tape measure protein
MTSPQQGVNLGSAYGTITINDNIDGAINRAVGQFDNALTSIGGKMEALGSQMSDIGGQLTLATAPLTAFGAAGIHAAGNFEDAMAEIQARAGLTNEAMETISATALQLGADTAFSAQEAADGFLMLMTAGLDTEEALATLPAVLTGAAAAGADLGRTTEQVTNIMSSFQLEVGEAARIVEVMNQAAGASPAEMSEMGEALADVGGDARTFGLSLEQTGAALTILARNGKKGSEAANQLRSIFTAMTADTADSRRAWEMVGTSLFDAGGNARDFGVVLAEVEAGLQNLNAEDQAFVIQSLAGSFGRVGFNALLASEGIESVIGEMNEQATATEVAEGRLDTFNGRLESLMGSFEALMITVFMPFIEMLTPFVERVIALVNVFTEWVAANQAIVQPMLLVLAAVLAIGPALLALGTVISTVGAVLGGLGSLLGFLLSPIVLVTAAIAALVYIFRDELAPVFAVVQSAITSLITILTGLWTAFQAGGVSGAATFLLDNVFTPLMNSIQTIDWTQVGIAILTAIGAGLTMISDWATWIYTNLLLPLFNNFQTAVASVDWARVGSSILTAIGTAITATFNFITWIYDNLLVPFMNNAQAAIESVDWGLVGYNLVNAIGMAIKATFDFITWIVDSIFGPVTENAEGAAVGVDWSVVGTAIMNAIGGAITAVWDFIVWISETILLPLIAGGVTAISQVDWGAIGTGIMDGIRNALPNIGQWVTDNIITPIRNALANFNPMEAVQNAGNAVSTGWQNIQSFGSMVGGALGWQDDGGPGTAGVPYMIGTGAQPEMFIPQTNGTFVPNADQLMGGMNFAGANFTINANSYAEGAAAARGFKEQIEELMRST